MLAQPTAAAPPPGGGVAAAPPGTPETVLAWVSAALSPDQSSRVAAERALATAEEDAAPGYLSALLDIITAVDAVAEVRGMREG